MRERGGNPAQAHPSVPVPPLRTPDRRLIGLTIISPCSAGHGDRRSSSAKRPPKGLAPNGLSVTISGFRHDRRADAPPQNKSSRLSLTPDSGDPGTILSFFSSIM
jgi:hypothetical protein